MFSSVSGHHFAGHWDKGVPPPPPITSLRYSLQNGSGTFINPSTGLTYLKNIDRVETDGGGDLYWYSTLPTVNTTTSPYNITNAYRSTPGVTLYSGSLVLRSDKDNVVNVWMRLQAYTTSVDQFFTFTDIFNNSGYVFYIQSNGALRGLTTTNGLNVAGTISSQTLPLNQWKMVTVYFRNSSSSSAKIYIDGVLTDAITSQNGNMNNLSQMNLTLYMGDVNSTPAAKWNDFRMYVDDGVTPAQIYAAEKAYYLGGFTGELDTDATALTKNKGIFIQSNFIYYIGWTNYGSTGLTNGSSPFQVARTAGVAGVSPPYLVLETTNSISGGIDGTLITSTNYVHFNVWVNPVGTIPTGTLATFTAGAATITLSMNSSRQISASVNTGSFTRNLSTLTSVPLNKWSMVGVSVVFANTLICYLTIDGTALSGGGATGNNATTTSMVASIRMLNSSNLRWNQFTVTKDVDFTPQSLYEYTKSSYGRI